MLNMKQSKRLICIAIGLMASQAFAQHQYDADIYYYVPQMPKRWGGTCFPHLSTDENLALGAVYAGFQRQAGSKRQAAKVSSPVKRSVNLVNGKPYEFGFRWTYRLMGPGGVVKDNSGSGSNDTIRAAAVCYGKSAKFSVTRIDAKDKKTLCNANTPKPTAPEEIEKRKQLCTPHIKVQCNTPEPKPVKPEEVGKRLQSCDYTIIKPVFTP